MISRTTGVENTHTSSTDAAPGARFSQAHGLGATISQSQMARALLCSCDILHTSQVDNVSTNGLFARAPVHRLGGIFHVLKKFSGAFRRFRFSHTYTTHYNG